MKTDPCRIITAPDATIKRITEAVGEHLPGDTLMVEIESEDRLSRLSNKLNKVYPYSEFLTENFTTDGVMMAYIYICKRKSKLKEL